MALFSGFAFAWVNANQLGTVAFGLLGIAPKVQIAANRVAAPNDDEFGFCKKLDPHADLSAQRLRQALTACRRADGTVQQGRTEAVKKSACHRFALHQAHGSRVAVWRNRFRVAGGDGFKLAGNVCERCVPGDRFKLPRPFGAAAFEGSQQALRVMGALGIARNLVAQHAAGLWVSRVALYFGGDAVFNRCKQRAGVGAVMRTSAAHWGLGLSFQMDNSNRHDRAGADGFLHGQTLIVGR